jgi:exosortase A-associated hydrolase 1
MSYTERALTFECEGECLVGVLVAPAAPGEVAVLIVVGGPQYRGGSHRQFVLLARRLAAAGIPVLRFDCRGMGDSTGPMQTFEDSGPDLAAAIEALLTSCPSVRRVVLWGLCDAAASALIYVYATADRRVAGLVLLNPWVRSRATYARTELRHYYLRRLGDSAFWAKFLRGRVDVAGATIAVAEKFVAARVGGRRGGATHADDYRDRMAEGLRSFAGAVLIFLSERDLTAKEFLEHVQSSPSWSGRLEQANVELRPVAGADHTFSTTGWRDEIEAGTLDWLRRNF